MDINEAWGVLGLAPTADIATVRRQFRALTKTLHPDRREARIEDKAALDLRYTDVSIAFEMVLEQLEEQAAVAWVVRHQPDQFEGIKRGNTALQLWLTHLAFWRQHPTKPRQIETNDAAGMASWLRMSELVRVALATATPEAKKPTGQLPGVEMRAKVRLPVSVSIFGGKHEVEIEVGRSRRHFELEVPRGIDVDGEFRIRGAGGPGEPRGDLVLRVELLEADGGRFKRNGLTLTTHRQVTYAQVYAGRIITIRTPWGTSPLQLRAGDETQHRLVGQGVRVDHGNTTTSGDLLVELDVIRPAPGNAKLAAALLEAQHGDPEHRSPGDPVSDRSAR